MDDKLEEIAFTIAGEAAGLLRDWFYEEGLGEVVGKGASGDDTRRADNMIEEYVLNRLKETGVELLIITEEQGTIRTSSTPKYVALIDPLDGSLNYVSKIPLAAVSIAFYDSKRPYIGQALAGAVANVFSREIYSFDKDNAYLNGKKIVREKTLFKGLISIYTDDPDFVKKIRDLVIRKFQTKPKFRTLGSASIEAVYAAMNRIDLFIHNTGRLRNFDIACGVAIAKRLKTYVASLTGNELSYRVDRIEFVKSIIIGEYGYEFVGKKS